MEQLGDRVSERVWNTLGSPGLLDILVVMRVWAFLRDIVLNIDRPCMTSEVSAA